MPSLKYLHTLNNRKNINTKDCFQNGQFYMCTYRLKQHKQKHKYLFPKFPVLPLYISYTSTQKLTQSLKDKVLIITCEHTLYNNTYIKQKSCWYNSNSYICTYTLQQHKHKHKVSLWKWLVLHVYITYTTTKNMNTKSFFKSFQVSHMNIHSTTSQTKTKRLVAKIPSLTCINTLFNNTNIYIKACCIN